MHLEPTRLMLARALAALSHAGLARLLGTSAGQIAAWERGASFGSQHLGALASVLRCSPDYLCREPASLVDRERIFFRAPRRISTTHKQAAAALGRVGTDFYAQLHTACLLPATSLPDLAGLDPATAAGQLRLDWAQDCQPMPLLIPLLESYGVRVLGLPEHLGEVDTFSFWEEGQGYIFVNTAKPVAQVRMDIAHEVGHLVLHSSLGADFAAICQAELEAERFAIHLLIPSAIVSAVVTDQLAIEDLLGIEQQYGVPAGCVIRFAHSLGLLSDATYSRLVRELDVEPERPGFPEHASRVFELALPRLRQEHSMNSTQLASWVGLDAKELHQLTFGQALVLVAGGTGAAPHSGPHRHLNIV